MSPAPGHDARADAATWTRVHAGTRRMPELMAAERRPQATVRPDRGGKGYDGFALALVTG